MNLKQYQIETLRTFAYRKEPLSENTTDMLHCAIGLSTEVGELVEAMNKEDEVNIGEEIADQMWYVSNLCNFINTDIYHTFSLTKKQNQNKYFCTNRACVLSGMLLDKFKRHIFYGSSLDKNEIELCLSNIIQNLYDLCESMKFDMEKLLENNIAKLRVRFPDKFTQENAENRNLEGERKELEK